MGKHCLGVGGPVATAGPLKQGKLCLCDIFTPLLLLFLLPLIIILLTIIMIIIIICMFFLNVGISALLKRIAI